MDEHIFYIETCIISSVACVLCAVLLLWKNRLKSRLRVWSDRVVPQRYSTARSALAIAYLVIAGLAIVRVVLNPPDKIDVFLPLSGLIVSSSQAMLFTAALLALYDSNLLRYEIVVGNILPFFMLIMLKIIVGRGSNECIDLTVRYIWLGLYIVQLVVYTVFFYRERWKYLRMEESVCGESEESRKKHDKVIRVLFPCSLAVGILALVSYFFTTEWEMSVFIIVYTMYYIAVAIYFLCYEARYEDTWIRKRLKNEE